MTGKRIIFAIVVIVVIIAIVYGIKYIKYQSLSPFQYVIKKGATKSTTQGVGDRFDYPADPNDLYGFYPNNRAVEFATGKKGYYDKERILWDDGSTTLMSDIFK